LIYEPITVGPQNQPPTYSEIKPLDVCGWHDILGTSREWGAVNKPLHLTVWMLHPAKNNR